MREAGLRNTQPILRAFAYLLCDIIPVILELTSVTHDPDTLGGKPCVRHMPVPAAAVLSWLAAGRSQEEILRARPELAPEDIKDILLFAAWRIEEPVGLQPPERNPDKPLPPAPGQPDAGQSAHCPIALLRSGVFDARLGIGIIAWRDIAQFTLVTRHGVEGVSLEVIKPERYMARLPGLRRYFAGFLSTVRVNPFVLSTAGTGLTGDQLLTQVSKVWLLYRNDNWLPPRNIPEFSALAKTSG